MDSQKISIKEEIVEYLIFDMGFNTEEIFMILANGATIKKC
jgi:hypothetical protein